MKKEAGCVGVKVGLVLRDRGDGEGRGQHAKWQRGGGDRQRRQEATATGGNGDMWYLKDFRGENTIRAYLNPKSVHWLVEPMYNNSASFP